MRGYYRHTKIVATVGPATESEQKLSQIINLGVDVIRLNMAHGTGEWVQSLVARIRSVSSQLQRQVAVMMDVKGPEIRTGPVPEAIELNIGDEFEFYTETPTPGVTGVIVNYPGLPGDVAVGSTVLVDSGLLRLEVLSKDETHVLCRVLTPGKLGSRRHINLPGVDVNLPSLTEKDERDIRAGVAAGIDFYALSFVRRSDDILVLRALLDSLGSRARIVAKIEDQSGLRNLEAIVKVTDAVMVARGDLGIEIDYHVLPLVQRRIVDNCLAEGKPVIIATHLLESMISAPMPTRAEISDVSNAVRERADAVMLSGETTTGLYPLECVEVLKNIVKSTEPVEVRGMNDAIKLTEPKSKMLRSAAVLAQELGQSGIVVFTRSGFLAYTLGALRPIGVPIYAFTDDEALFRQLLLPWGVEPFLMPFSDDPEETIQNALKYLKRRSWCDRGTWLVVITNALAHGKVIDSLQLRQIE
ncbi:pyruvate kinase [Humisphaera borealis]|uniref:Pyruvate kinase n=1 Tax=Humisphaera borealis TaxID=2807512 RepID=A0A7M2WYH7_9BACT|nr:pyruvate kinase [Humisphaera borealis]QOV90463.1 pyruvate kinase [Humisphaera borealis]